MTCFCLLSGTNYLHSYIVLAEVQGSFTFSPQQMPHASTIIRVSPFGQRAEKPMAVEVPFDEVLTTEIKQLLGTHWSHNHRYWQIPCLDGVIGNKIIGGKFKAHLMICNKRNFFALIREIWGVRRNRVDADNGVDFHYNKGAP
jgi:hypothetical protein